jgi:hypothetical protein
LKKNIHANGKIRTVYQGRPGIDIRLADDRKMLVPSRRSANRVDAQRREAAQVVRRRIGRREFNGNLNAA